MQNRNEQRTDRLPEINQPPHRLTVEDLLSVTHVRLQDSGPVIGLQKSPAHTAHDRIAVHVHDPGGTVDALRDLVHVVLRRQP
ncbi:hypothetical protein SGRI78S_02868 [Streptomyces griseus subsp. griseus]